MTRYYSKPYLEQVVDTTAREYGVSSYVMKTVIGCESKWNPYAVSTTYDYGLSQINAPSWPAISKKQMDDPSFAAKFLAEKLAKGEGSLWTCYRNNFQ